MDDNQISELAFSGQYEAALKACRLRMWWFEKSHFTAFLRGYCHYHLGRFNKAARWFEKALKQSPNDLCTMVFCSLAGKAVGQADHALKQADTALRPAETKSESPQMNMAVIACLSDLPKPVRQTALSYCVSDKTADLPDINQIEAFTKQLLTEGGFEASAQKIVQEDLPRIGTIMSVSDVVAAKMGGFLHQAPPDTIRFVHLSGAPLADTNSSVEEFPGYKGYVAGLTDMVVSGGSGAIFSKNGAVISDSYADSLFGSYIDLRADSLVHARHESSAVYTAQAPTRKVARAVNLSGLGSNHFGHWFSEYLPRLRHFEALDGSKNIPLLVNDDMPQSHFDFLAAICANPLIKVGRDEAVLVKELLVAPTITYYPFALLPEHKVPIESQACWSGPAMQFIRDKVLDGRENNCIETGNAIYLSRQNSSWGRPQNEDSFVRMLAARNVKPVFLEHMNFATQIETIQSAKTIIAPTGSALNMLIFAHPQTRILIFMQNHAHNWGGWIGPLQELGITPQMAMMDGGSVHDKHASFVMRLDVLDAFLNEPGG